MTSRILILGILILGQTCASAQDSISAIYRLLGTSNNDGVVTGPNAVRLANLTRNKSFADDMNASSYNTATQSDILRGIANFWDSRIIRPGASETEKTKAWAQSLIHWEDYLAWRVSQMAPGEQATEQEKESWRDVTLHTAHAVYRLGKAAYNEQGCTAACEKYTDIATSYYGFPASKHLHGCLLEAAPFETLKQGDAGESWWKHLVAIRQILVHGLDPVAQIPYRQATSTMEQELSQLTP